MKSRILPLFLLLVLPLLPACQTDMTTVVDASKQELFDKPTEGWGLRKLDPKDYPDMRTAWLDKTGLERAIDKSLQYLAAPSSQRVYPSGLPGDTITHDQVQATLTDCKRMLHEVATADAFQHEILTRYDVYESIGYNNKGDVWFTGYFTPEYHGSTSPTAEYRYPVYSKPNDLDINPINGDVLGYVGTHQPYPTRQELLASNKLRGLEIMWFKDPIEPYIIQVQGSAKVTLPDGSEVLLGYAGKNGRDYHGLGSELVKDGKIDRNHLSLPAVLDYFKQHPTELNEYMNRNESFAFLKKYERAEWPSGSLGVQVTAQRSLATDKKIFPRASMAFVMCDKPSSDGTTIQPYRGLVLDQDTGGAIRAAGRADLYMGMGEVAGRQAGHQFAQGRLYYIFLKPTLVPAVPVSHPALKPVTPAKTPAGPAKTPADSDIFPGATGTTPRK